MEAWIIPTAEELEPKPPLEIKNMTFEILPVTTGVVRFYSEDERLRGVFHSNALEMCMADWELLGQPRYLTVDIRGEER